MMLEQRAISTLCQPMHMDLTIPLTQHLTRTPSTSAGSNLLREIAVRNGDSEKPIWLNEYGWNASPEDFDPEALIWSRVSEADQAQWTAKESNICVLSMNGSV